MSKYLGVAIVALLIMGGIFYYQSNLSQKNANPNSTPIEEFSVENSIPKGNVAPQPNQPASVRQLFWEIPANSNVSLSTGASVRVGTVSLQNGQMVGILAITNAGKTEAVTVNPPNLKFTVSGLSFEVCSIGQSEARPSGEVSFSVATGNESPLCPDSFAGESHTDPKFRLAN